MKRAVIYARYSSDKQREESIDAQVRACKEYCVRKHYLVTKIYADEAKSGRDIAKRDAYNQMLADAVEGKFDIIIFHKIDRNSRNEFNYYTVQHTLNRLGIEYAYAQLEISNTPEGKFFESMFVAQAAFYSRNLAKETKKGLNENAYKAQFNGGRPPLGYKIVNKHYEIEPHEAEAVRLIFKMYLSGHGYNKIAHELNIRGFKTREGREFGKNSLHDILGNERYIGTYIFNKTARKEGMPRNMHPKTKSPDFIKIEDAFPPIISKEDFWAAQNMRKNNRRRSAKYTAKADYILSGKIFCGCCGSAMVGHRVTTRKQYYHYYACNKKDRIAVSKCHQKQIQRDLIEKYVINLIKEKVFSPKNIEIIVQDMLKKYNAYISSASDNKKRLQLEKAAAERKLDNLYKLFERGTADEYDFARLNNVKCELKSIESQLNNILSKAAFPKLTYTKIAETLAKLKEKLTFDDDLGAKKTLINLFVEKIVVNVDEISIFLSTGKIFCLSGSVPSAPK